MSAMLDTPVSDLVTEWWGLSTKLAKVKEDIKNDVDRELELRKHLVSRLFPLLSEVCRLHMEQTGTDNHAPDCKCGTEGVNYYPLPKDYKAKGTVVIDRKVDEAAMKSVCDQLEVGGVNPDTIFRWKPELETKAYKELDKAVQRIVDQALIIKPGAPKLEIVAPKEKK